MFDVSLDFSKWDRFEWLLSYIHNETKNEIKQNRPPKVGMFVGCIAGLSALELKDVARLHSLHQRDSVLSSNGGKPFVHSREGR